MAVVHSIPKTNPGRERVCSLANPVVSRGEWAYPEIINIVSQFRAIGGAPHPDVELPNEESLYANRTGYCR